MAGLIKRKTETPQGPQHELASTLRDALRKARKEFRPADLDRWAAAFAEHLQSNDVIETTAVLSWYCERIGRPGIPKAFSAASFCACYEELKTKRGLDPRAVVVGPVAQALAEELAEEHWPGGADQDLPAVCQVTLDAHTAFMQRLARCRRRYAGRCAADPAIAARDRFAEEMQHEYGDTGGKDFARKWLLLVRDKLAGWRGWDGTLMQFAFDPAGERFRKLGCDLAVAWCGHSRRFDEVLADVLRT